MELIADGLLILAAMVASIYCLVLSRRLRRLNRLDNGLGGAIASLSVQVDEMRNALSEAKQATERSKRELDARTKRAEKAAGRLELLLAAVRTTGEGKTLVSEDDDAAEDEAEGSIDPPARQSSTKPDAVAAAVEDPEDAPRQTNPSAFEDMDEIGPAQTHPDLAKEDDLEPTEVEQENELRLADALADPSQLKRADGGGISSDLLAALSKVAGGKNG
ncbi:MAG: hypothetical protein AAFR17_18140 [Pseudomonadota bacterium]